MASVNGVRSVDLGVAALGPSEEFYTKVWGLSVVHRQEGAVYLRATGADHHVLALHQRPTDVGVLRVTLRAPDRAAVDALHRQVEAVGATDIIAPAELDEIAEGYGFSFRDREGRFMQVVADDRRHADVTPHPDRPVKITHVVFNTTDIRAMTDYYIRALGFRQIDEMNVMIFLNCNTDHHVIAFAQSTGSTLNHISFEMKDVDAVMRGAGRMQKNGFTVDWGVGRHGPANNVYSYFVGPNNEIIEYTTEVEQIDENYQPNGHDYWMAKYPPGQMDHWGYAVMTERFKWAHGRFPFSPASAFRPDPVAR